MNGHMFSWANKKSEKVTLCFSLEPTKRCVTLFIVCCARYCYRNYYQLIYMQTIYVVGNSPILLVRLYLLFRILFFLANWLTLCSFLTYVVSVLHLVWMSRFSHFSFTTLAFAMGRTLPCESCNYDEAILLGVEHSRVNHASRMKQYLCITEIELF
jgi:hypothetical protein